MTKQMPNVSLSTPKIKLLFDELPAEQKDKCAEAAQISITTIYRWMKKPGNIPSGKLQKIQKVMEKHYGAKYQLEELLQPVKI